MVLVEVDQGFRRDCVGAPLSPRTDGSLEPILFYPGDDLCLSDVQGARQRLHREEVTANLANAELVSPQNIADGLGRPIELLRHLFDRPLHQFLSHDVEFGLGPTAVVYLSLDSVLNDEAPACFLGAA